MRQAKILKGELFAGMLVEYDRGYRFTYDNNYLAHPDAIAISLTMPLSKEFYGSNVLFPFFDGLDPEGWLLDIATSKWKADRRDRMGLLLAYS